MEFQFQLSSTKSSLAVECVPKVLSDRDARGFTFRIRCVVFPDMFDFMFMSSDSGVIL